MGGDTVQQFFIRVSNDYLIGNFAPQLNSEVDADEDVQLDFVKKEIIRLRRDRDLSHEDARQLWEECESSENVREYVCSMGVSMPTGLFGDDQWYVQWPTVPNHETNTLNASWMLYVKH
jgi:hypothetical protein